MIIKAKSKLFVTCPACGKGDTRADHLNVGSLAGPWTCDACHKYYLIVRINDSEFELTLTGEVETPITVTLKSDTEPPIFVKLNAWKYGHSQKDTPEEFFNYQEYFYNEHTCPTNWTDQIEQVIFEGDKDPHGVFKLVSIEDGHQRAL